MLETVGEKQWRRLLAIMRRLRSEQGCPWDKEQTHQSLKRYLVEEAYEVLDAIDSGDDASLCDELGDVLLQVVFHAQIAEEQGRFNIDDVVAGICAKMERRHPHVFADDHAENAAEVLTLWEEIKAAERASSGGEKRQRGLMYLNENLPALMMAQKVQDKASRVGFDWPDKSGPRAAVTSELAELDAAVTPAQQQEELGDCLFALVNLGRFYALDAEESLRLAVKKFIRRFNYIERVLTQKGIAWQETTLADLDALWQEAKQKEKDGELGHEIG